jgi:translation initiation factor 2 alpha subunit (eIF-2alpha)
MNSFLTGLIVSVLSNEKVQKMIKDLLGSLIKEQIVPLIPVAVTAAVDSVIKQMPGVENIKELGSVADDVRNTLNYLIPDIDLPIIGDLTDFWRPKS